jgi:hypothetical protein
MQDELDKKVQSLFRQGSQSLPEEPFFGNMLKLVKRRQSRRVFRQRLILVLGFSCCAVLSPFLIKGSILLSDGLNRLLEAAGHFWNTPVGMATAALCALLLLIFRRRLISALV